MGNIQAMKGIVNPQITSLSLFTHLLVIPESHAVIYSVKGKKERCEVDRSVERRKQNGGRGSQKSGWEVEGVCTCWCRDWLSGRNRVKLGRKRDCETLSGCWPLLQPAWRADLAWPTAPQNLLSALMTTHTHTRTHTDPSHAFTQMQANKKSRTPGQ